MESQSQVKSEWWEEWKGKGSGVERVLGEINGRAFVFGRKFKQEMLDREGRYARGCGRVQRRSMHASLNPD